MAADDLTRLRRDALRRMATIGAALVAVLLAATATGRIVLIQGVAGVICYAALCALTLRALATHLPRTRFGAANFVTLARGAAIAGLTGLLFGPLDDAALWVAAGVALVSIALDGLDGVLARVHAAASPFGARFDMEIDAALILVLGALLIASGQTGLWVLLTAGARYIFVAAGYMIAALKAPLPYSERRRVVCVIQSVTLALALSPALPPPLAGAIAGLGLAATAYSFAVDVFWLLRSAAQHA